MRIFSVIFQYVEQGGGSFRLKLEAWDLDHAMELGRHYSDWARAHGVGDFLPVAGESAFSMSERDLEAMDVLRRLSVV